MTLYLFYAVSSLFWNAMAAGSHRRHSGLSNQRKLLAYTSFAFMILGLSWIQAGSTFSGSPVLVGLSALLPAAYFFAALQCAAAARAGQRTAWLLVASNGFLGFLLLLRWVANLGVDTGVFGESLSLSYAAFQSVAFLPALWFPMYVQLPWLARPSAAPQSVTRFVWWVGISFATLSVLAVLWVWPSAWGSVASWRNLPSPSPSTAVADARLLRSSKILDTMRSPPDPRFLQRELARLSELGIEAATIVLGADLLLENPLGLPDLERFVEDNRSAGRSLILSVVAPARWYQGGWPAGEETEQVLGRACGIAARRFQPDYQIVLGDPLGMNSLLIGGRGTEQAGSVIAALADSVRLSSPDTKVAIYGFQPWPGEPHADSLAVARRDLFVWAAADSSPVDRVGIVLHPAFGSAENFRAQLAMADSLLEFVGETKRLWVFEFAVAPETMGETAQRKHLEWVVSWAQERIEVEGVSQLSLGDYAERVGLVNSLGRKRQAWEAYRRPVPVADR